LGIAAGPGLQRELAPASEDPLNIRGK
jgi:hypothetical protein